MKTMKPTTSGLRMVVYESRSEVSVKKPFKKLTKPSNKIDGRDRFGHISIRHRGNGEKRMYRMIDFSQSKNGETAQVNTIEYDPNRNARIALIRFEDGERRYIIAPADIKIGQNITISENTTIKLGNRMQIGNIPTGIMIHNIELQPNSKAKLVRSAGTGATILSKDDRYAYIKLPSSEVRKFGLKCFASIGQVSNIEHKAIKVGKAGRKRHMGIRPTVRGKVMSPRSHPHGGGEGVNPIGLKYPKTPWGKHAIGGKTRKKSKPSSILIVKRRLK